MGGEKGKTTFWSSRDFISVTVYYELACNMSNFCCQRFVNFLGKYGTLFEKGTSGFW